FRPGVVALREEERGEADVAEGGEVGHSRGLGYVYRLAREGLRLPSVRRLGVGELQKGLHLLVLVLRLARDFERREEFGPRLGVLAHVNEEVAALVAHFRFALSVADGRVELLGVREGFRRGGQ